MTLDFDVAHIGQKFFHKKSRIAEGSLGHGGRLEKSVFQLGFVMNGKNTPAAPAAFCLEHDRQAYFRDQLAGRADIYSAV